MRLEGVSRQARGGRRGVGWGEKRGERVKKRQRMGVAAASYLMHTERLYSYVSRSSSSPSIPSLIFCLKFYLIKKKKTPSSTHSLQCLIHSVHRLQLPLQTREFIICVKVAIKKLQAAADGRITGKAEQL